MVDLSAANPDCWGGRVLSKSDWIRCTITKRAQIVNTLPGTNNRVMLSSHCIVLNDHASSVFRGCQNSKTYYFWFYARSRPFYCEKKQNAVKILHLKSINNNILHYNVQKLFIGTLARLRSQSRLAPLLLNPTPSEKSKSRLLSKWNTGGLSACVCVILAVIKKKRAK